MLLSPGSKFINILRLQSDILAYMPANHTILEFRTGRDSEHTPESATQLFASIPNLRS